MKSFRPQRIRRLGYCFIGALFILRASKSSGNSFQVKWKLLPTAVETPSKSSGNSFQVKWKLLPSQVETPSNCSGNNPQNPGCFSTSDCPTLALDSLVTNSENWRRK
jgi:hypothetical protein